MAEDLVYSRADFTWLPRDEYERRRADREERAFQRKASQGQLCAPATISDGTGKDLQSQCSGKWFDSKSELRKDYKQHGCVEVGNDVPKTRFIHGDKPPADPMKDRKQWDALHKAANRVGLPA